MAVGTLWVCLLFLAVGLCAQGSGETVGTNAPPVTEPDPQTVARLERESQIRRGEYWEELKKWIPPVESFEQWQSKSRELPPDFQRLSLTLEKFPPQSEDPDFSLPTPLIPDPLRGLLVMPTMPGDILLKIWNGRRNEILGLYTWWVLGSSPPAPKEVLPEVLPGRTESFRCFTQRGILRMGEDVKAEINVEMVFPKEPVGNLQPVVVLPSEPDGSMSRATEEFSQASVSRGFIVCRYWPGVGLDKKSLLEPGEGTNSVRVLAQWAMADWGDLCREAWMMRRVVDYLVQFQQIDRGRIALAGEEFYAKAAIAAAAADTRISATIAFSPGLAGFTPFRTLSEMQMGGGIEGLTREHPEWVNPRLRFFSGREHYLPFEQTDLAACIAPRALYVATLNHDPSESLWGNEQALQVLQKTYLQLGAPPRRLFLQEYSGAAFTRESREKALDWLEFQWGMRRLFDLQTSFYPTYEKWQETAGTLQKPNPLSYLEKSYEDILSFPSGNPVFSPDNWDIRRTEMREKLEWALGNTPPLLMKEPEFEAEPLQVAALMRRSGAPPTLLKGGVRLSNGTHADFYFKEGADTAGTNLPVVIWQPGFSVPGGYTASQLRGEPPYFEMALSGFLVMVFDPIGCGTRIEEARSFYERYPNWSLLGKMVQDVSLAVDALGRIPFADPKKIYLVGYDTGGMAALHAAAMDPGIAGVVSVGGFAPMRINKMSQHLGGIGRWVKSPLLAPRLACFEGHERRLPYDFNEVLGLVAPRPAWIITFKEDSVNSQENLTRCLDSAARVYSLLESSSKLFFELRDDYNHYTPDLNRQVIQFLQRQIAADAKPQPRPVQVVPAQKR